MRCFWASTIIFCFCMDKQILSRCVNLQKSSLQVKNVRLQLQKSTWVSSAWGNACKRVVWPDATCCLLFYGEHEKVVTGLGHIVVSQSRISGVMWCMLQTGLVGLDLHQKFAWHFWRLTMIFLWFAKAHNIPEDIGAPTLFQSVSKVQQHTGKRITIEKHWNFL